LLGGRGRATAGNPGGWVEGAVGSRARRIR
jgi:hypothetical protein